jgi:cytidylate kinase
MTDTITIAIDGPAASGKGTIARKIAEHFGLRHLDTGSLYRGVAALVRDQGIFPTDGEAVGRIAGELTIDVLERDDLRDAGIGNLASIVAAHPQVRTALMEWQRNFAMGGAVLDGRDIGTVILPDATAKLFVTAEIDVRAARRWRELSKDEDIAYRTVLESIEERDRRDAERSSAPMEQAKGAVLLDTTEMTVDQAVAEALRLTEKQIKAA